MKERTDERVAGLLKRAERLLAGATLVIGVIMPECVAAQQTDGGLSPYPILRIEATAHTAQINRIATDQENRYAVTVSLDKTARIWSLPDNRLISVLRVPIGDGNLGKLYAVAMTPDGETVAVGGWTGETATHNVYVFDRSSGRLRQRVSGLPNVILHLAYSTDGSLLVAASGGQNGIRVFDAAHKYKPLPSDTDYAGSNYWADFDRRENLVTTSFDGFVRLYASGRYDSPISKVKPSQIRRPYWRCSRRMAAKFRLAILIARISLCCPEKILPPLEPWIPPACQNRTFLLQVGLSTGAICLPEAGVINLRSGAGRTPERGNISILTLAILRSCS